MIGRAVFSQLANLTALSEGTNRVLTVAICGAVRTNVAANALHLAGGRQDLLAAHKRVSEHAALADAALPLARAGISDVGLDKITNAIRAALVAVPTLCVLAASGHADLI
jgi:hypothetical protein